MNTKTASLRPVNLLSVYPNTAVNSYPTVVPNLPHNPSTAFWSRVRGSSSYSYVPVVPSRGRSESMSLPASMTSKCLDAPGVAAGR